MPNYKLNELDHIEREKIISFLTSSPVGVLAVVDTEGNPHASTIYFSVDKELNITFTTKRDTFKYKNLSKHDAIMLVAFDASKQMAVQISGRAKKVTDPETAHTIYQGTLRAVKKTYRRFFALSPAVRNNMLFRLGFFFWLLFILLLGIEQIVRFPLFF
ncbi:MAG: pyridoxamine 5'-phosphate oxidase family protein, partial [Patescibacteria group bacterium]